MSRKASIARPISAIATGFCTPKPFAASSTKPKFLSSMRAIIFARGHPPFGHTGEDALAAAMEGYGGFDHNAQALKIVTTLEIKYAEFDGLNLTWESLEGIAKHNGPVTGDLPFALADYNARYDLELETFAGPEAQVAALSDDIAYNNHDLDDGLRAGLFEMDELRDLPLVGDCLKAVDEKYPNLEPNRRRHETLRRVFGAMVEDVIAQSEASFARTKPTRVEDIRALSHASVTFSDAMLADINTIRKFLFTRMYRAPSVLIMRKQTTSVVEQLFATFMDRPELLPPEWKSQAPSDEQALARLVADYIAGMTDRYAFGALERIKAV